MSSKDGKYFTSSKKGDVYELQQQLNSTKKNEKVDCYSAFTPCGLRASLAGHYSTFPPQPMAIILSVPPHPFPAPLYPLACALKHR